MRNKILCLILILSLILAGNAAADSAGPVTAAELNTLLTNVRESVLAASPLNDPASEDALSEDGVRFQYENVILYLPQAEITAESPVNCLLFSDSEGDVFRSTGVDTQWVDLLSAFPLDNPDLRGTREQAVLYLRGTDGDGWVFGRILRDGQRITAAEYGEVLPESEGFRIVSVTYSLLDGLVTSLRVDGLNPGAASTADAAQVRDMRAELEELLNTDEYRAVPTSRTGTDLTPFGPEDLTFSGIRFTALTPETLPGEPDTEMMDDGDGSWLMRCDGDGYEAVFRCDENGSNPKILSLTILDENFEGPRCVRLGDLFSDDYSRFRSEGNVMTEDLSELLYGEEGTAPWGRADYDYASGETGLRYVTEADGTEVELLLRYELNRLTEIILRTL